MRKLQRYRTPAEILTPLRIELTGNREVLVEGHKGIIEYNENLIKLSCRDKVLNIVGSSLRILMFSSEYILAEGEIESVSFLL